MASVLPGGKSVLRDEHAVLPGGHSVLQGEDSVLRAGHGAARVREFELSITGMTCASCASRIERKLNKIDHVAAAVNYATHRARVTAPAGVSAQALIDEIGKIGYTAALARPPGGPDDDEEAASEQVRALRRRLTVALVFFIPLCDLSILLSLFPGYRFPGLAVAADRAGPAGRHVGGLAVPPAALRNARHDLLDGHPGLAGHRGRLRLVRLRDVRAGPRPGGAAAVEPAARLRRRHLPGGRRLGDHLPAGRAAVSRRRPGVPPGRPCATWPQPAPGTPACWTATGPSSGYRPLAPAGPAVRGPPRRADCRRRRGAVRPVGGRPQHDDRGVGAGRRRRRGQRHGRHHRPDRPPGGPRRQGRRGHPARAPDQDGGAGAGGEGQHPAAGRPDLRGVRPGRAVLSVAHPGRVAAGGQPAGARVQRRPRRADHRLPLRARPRHPGRAGGRLRPRRSARHLHQGLPGAGVCPGRSAPSCWTRPAP